MNWSRVAFMLAGPPAVAALIALPFWLRGKAIVGNSIGSGLIILTSLYLGLAERVDVLRHQQRCVEQGIFCSLDVPALFRHMATYVLIGFVEIAVLFTVSAIVERRRERSHVDPEWR